MTPCGIFSSEQQRSQLGHGRAGYKMWPWMIIYAIVLHFTWGICIFIDPVSAIWPTSVNTLAFLFGGAYQTATASVIASLMAIASFWFSRRGKLGVAVYLCIPQQLIMIVSFIGAISAVYSSSFADGVVRPSMFIMADQLPSLIAMPLHTMALYHLRLFRGC